VKAGSSSSIPKKAQDRFHHQSRWPHPHQLSRDLGRSQLTRDASRQKAIQGAPLGRDPRNDLALIKIEPKENLPVLKLAIPTRCK